MFLRLTGAAVRAVIVATLVMIPAFLLSGVTQSALEFTRILATIAAIMVLYEYGFSSPSVIEFRHAAPYNRVRFLILSGLILAPSYLISNALVGHAGNSTILTIAQNGFALMDFSYSPVSMVTETLSGGNIALRDAIAHAIALNIVIAMSCVIAFCLSIFANLWRFGGEDFNMWLNMPTYKTYDSSNLKSRLINSSYTSLLFACLIPLFGPMIAEVCLIWFAQDGILAPIFVAWLIAFWAYIPAIFLMRAAALFKVALNSDDNGQWIGRISKDTA